MIRASLEDLALDFKGRDVYVLTNQEIMDPQASSKRACLTLNLLDNPISKLLTSSFFCKTEHFLPRVHFPINDVVIATVRQMQADKVMVDDNGKGSISIINPSEVVCDQEKCQQFLQESMPMLYDETHFSWAGSIAVNSLILRTIGVEQGRVRTEFRTPPLIEVED